MAIGNYRFTRINIKIKSFRLITMITVLNDKYEETRTKQNWWSTKPKHPIWSQWDRCCWQTLPIKGHKKARRRIEGDYQLQLQLYCSLHETKDKVVLRIRWAILGKFSSSSFTLISVENFHLKKIGWYVMCIKGPDAYLGNNWPWKIPKVLKFPNKYIHQPIKQLCRGPLLSSPLYKYWRTRSLGALRAPTSSWRPFGTLDFVLRALRALRPCDPRRFPGNLPSSNTDASYIIHTRVCCYHHHMAWAPEGREGWS